jgi:hypothetical protein
VHIKANCLGIPTLPGKDIKVVHGRAERSSIKTKFVLGSDGLEISAGTIFLRPLERILNYIWIRSQSLPPKPFPIHPPTCLSTVYSAGTDSTVQSVVLAYLYCKTHEGESANTNGSKTAVMDVIKGKK